MAKHPRKRHNVWIDVGFSIVIMLLITVGVLLFFADNNKSASSSDEIDNIEIQPSTMETIDSNYQGIKIIIETSNDDFAPFAIQYPQSIHTTFNDSILSYIDNTKNNYLQTMSTYKDNNGEIHGELNVSFKTYLHNSGHYSFVIKTSSLSKGIDSLSEKRTFHLNPETEESISIVDVLDNKEEHLNNIAHLVKTKLEDDPKVRPYIIIDKFEIAMEPKWNNFSNFALTEEELIFYFDQFQFTVEEAGTPVVKIPLQQISDYISQPFKPIETAENNEDLLEDNQTDKVGITDETGNLPENVEQKSTTNTESSNEKQVALTFDDGPHPTVTRQILATLKKYDAKATFFMLGSRVDYYPDIAKDVQEAGHELGNHSWNHPDLTKMSAEGVFNEIKNTSTVIEKSTGQQATVFRPPYGANNATVKNQTDLPIVLWDVDTLDWKHRNAEQTLAIVKNNTKIGNTILMHDIHQSTADALESIIQFLKAEGYSFVTVSELE